MTSLPSDPEIRARAEELSLLEPGADLPHPVRKQVAKLLLDERAALAEAPPLEAAASPVLLSRLTQAAIGGTLQVDVLFIPNPPEGPPHG